MKSKVLAVIPARLGSTRFVGKVLQPIGGRPLLYHVWRQIDRAKTVDRILIATDSPKIARVAATFGADVILTSKRHQTGSDRVAEAAAGGSEPLIINVQADCLGLRPATLDRVISAMKSDRSIHYATLARPIRDDEELFDPGVVKVVTDRLGRALWFSRFPLPYLQRADRGRRFGQFKFLAHIGVYFFRRRALREFAETKRTPLERAESLEQLRVLENGRAMHVFKTPARTFSIDTPEDLKKIVSI